ncbi:MAG TPA: asparaginase [Pyrinomonadaceae bacterium]|nr:asparaginase [Pyrinomonadaceae bacterium]
MNIPDASSRPLVEVTRGSVVESVHRGHVVAVDGGGRVVARVGSPEVFTYVRSAAKPQQVLPLVTSGAAERFGLVESEIAVACGSHNGEPAHTEAVLSLLGRAGLDASSLKCGPHEPYGEEAAAALKERGERPSAIHNNCSGKHAAMLALAVHLGAPPDSYDRPGGPVQREVFAAVSQFAGVPAGDLRFAVDGCGLPAFALPLRATALMHARLASPPPEFGGRTREACRRVVAAMLAHPEMVEGDGELDTEIMRAAGGRLVSKVGAEGVYTAAVLPSERWPRGLGLALKIEDGDRGDRARPRAAVALLRRLGLLGEDLPRALSKLADPVIKNHRGDHVGEMRVCFGEEMMTRKE